MLTTITLPGGQGVPLDAAVISGLLQSGMQLLRDEAGQLWAAAPHEGPHLSAPGIALLPPDVVTDLQLHGAASELLRSVFSNLAPVQAEADEILDDVGVRVHGALAATSSVLRPVLAPMQEEGEALLVSLVAAAERRASAALLELQGVGTQGMQAMQQSAAAAAEVVRTAAPILQQEALLSLQSARAGVGELVLGGTSFVHAAGAVAAVVVEHFASALEAVAPSLPVIGVALSALASLVRLVQRMQHNTVEGGRLIDRVVRLQGLIERVSRDEGFVLRHEAIFEGMVRSLQSAEKTLTDLEARWGIMKLVNARFDIAQLALVDRTISTHLAELTAAMQAETLDSVKELHEAVSRREMSPSSPTTTVVIHAAPAVAQPPPPFSVQFTLKHIAFEPPLEEQLRTAPRGSYGVVAFGWWREMKLPVAVKMLPARGPTGEQVISIMSWLAEAEVMRRLRDSNPLGRRPEHIVLLYGIGAVEDASGHVSQYLVVMERLKSSLREVLDKYNAKKRLPGLDTALHWVLGCAKGL